MQQCFQQHRKTAATNPQEWVSVTPRRKQRLLLQLTTTTTTAAATNHHCSTALPKETATTRRPAANISLPGLLRPLPPCPSSWNFTTAVPPLRPHILGFHGDLKPVRADSLHVLSVLGVIRDNLKKHRRDKCPSRDGSDPRASRASKRASS